MLTAIPGKLVMVIQIQWHFNGLGLACDGLYKRQEIASRYSVLAYVECHIDYRKLIVWHVRCVTFFAVERYIIYYCM